jgi:hypothetical protein
MTTPSHPNDFAAEQFARKLTAHLSHSTADLPYVVTERLRAARVQAVSARKRSSTPLRALQTEASNAILGNLHDGTLSLGGTGHHDNTPLWVRRLLTALPLVALVGGLAFIGADQDSRATIDVAEVDAQLLTSELPPAAFTDPGFQQYLQTTVSDTP